MITAVCTPVTSPGPAVRSSQLLNTAEVAEVFRVAPNTIHSWVKAGRLPAPIRLSRRSARWPRVVIEALVSGKASS